MAQRKILYRRWPKVGERVSLIGDGDKERTITGTVTQVDKRNCGPGVARITLAEHGEALAEMGNIRLETVPRPDHQVTGYVNGTAVLRLLKDIKVLWDREGFGSEEDESEPLYNRLTKAIEELEGA